LVRLLWYIMSLYIPRKIEVICTLKWICWMNIDLVNH
jgi:hypothetical protein